jgi:hypothetical protein
MRPLIKLFSSYCERIGTDYFHALKEIISDSRKKPLKSSLVALTVCVGYYASKTKPDMLSLHARLAELRQEMVCLLL